MPSKIELIEQSFEQIKLHADQFAASFYANLFAAYPATKPLFANTDRQKQQKKLLDALILVVENLRHPEVLKEIVQALGARHVNYGVLRQHYPLVGKALLQTLKQYLGENWTPEVKAAWIYAYRGIVKLMLQGADYPPEAERSPITTTTPETEAQTQAEIDQETEMNAHQSHIGTAQTEVKPPLPLQPTLSSPIEVIENSFEKIKPRGEEFAASFYENLFAAYPEAKPLFANTDIQKQSKKLLNSLVLVVESLRNPEALAEVLRALGARHVNYGTLPQHYPLVGQALLNTLAQYLQDDWNSEVKNAWLFAYEQIMQLMFEGAGYSQTEPPTSPPLNTDETGTSTHHLQTSNAKTEINLQKAPVAKSSSKLQVEVIENSFEKIKPRGAEFAASFYENLFAAYPEAKPLFANTDMENQEKKLLNSLVLVVESLRNPEALAEVLRALGARHINYGTLKQHYPLVGKTILKTLKQYLQEDWTPEVKKAWVYALGQITKFMFEGAGYIKSQTPTIPNQQVQETTTKYTSEQEKKSLSTPTNRQKVTAQIKEEKEYLDQQYSAEKITEKLKKLLTQIVDIFWKLPKVSVVIIGVIIAILVVNLVGEDSIFAKTLDSADTISLLVAIILFVKETPDRRKEFHYQAWSTIDAAKGIKDSQARFMAIQDLNADRVSMRTLQAQGAYLANIDLKKSNLNEANLSEACLDNANLTQTNLSYANLSYAKLSISNLSDTNLSFSNLSNANLSSANLSKSNLVCADLSNANMSGANLSGATLSGAKLMETYLVGANLKDAKVSVAELSNAYLKDAIMPDGSKHT
ncbi:MAG: globin domain-containing protein [Microcoleaceae cyanobacterium]